ncbi:thymidine phosphorylase [Egicoccus halophilus]|uniref:Thymidine phosphorylase n=1 Tax=Egicoccus halophilus TaxID=1670830 RepID=A0A8J3A6Z7_9ACTN|nr:thymidine phosphorylase [Egicoccus halophilus]GGI04915.1 thymidine phosphorylase [Egicoccus halophilus]
MARLEIPVLIGRKRDGGELSHDELLAFVAAYVAGEVDDAQMAAFLMAGVIRGFSRQEAVALTEALLASGERIDLRGLRGPTVDKHSTGGVGDTTTLVVGPLLAAAGCQLAKLSGRGLGHTGGTLDKLEAIPGFEVDLDPHRLHDQVERIGLAVAAASQDLVPADKRLYALRDVTGTVASPALIASSVMSKKLAGGAEHVLLDVKAGSGAFLEQVDAARGLAELCVEIGRASDRHTAALVTDMSQPLGDAIGNALEVGAALAVLRGESTGRLRELSLALTAAMLELTGEAPAAAADRAAHLLDSGAGLDAFRDLVQAQGGDARVADAPDEVLPAAPVVREWRPEAGVITRFDGRRLGELAASLGAGRQRQGDTLDLAVGLVVHGRVGDEVVADEPTVRVHARTEADAEHVLRQLPEAIALGEEPVAAVPLVHARVGLPAR